MMDHSITEIISVLTEVIFINVVLSGDNAIVVGMAAAGLPAAQRLRALWLGILAATILRVVFALVATQLLQVVGLLLAGGILLLWVAWKLYREVVSGAGAEEQEANALLDGHSGNHAGPTKTFNSALWQIIVADVSMSLDNVMAVAGAAIDYPLILAIGLATSVLLMGFAASAIAKLLEKFRWIAYVGLVVIIYVALQMIWRGGHQVMGAMT